MISRKKINTIQQIQEIQYLATQCPCEVGLHSEDGSIIVDAKSYIGMYALDFNQPVLVISESAEFHEKIKNIGENLPEA